MPTAIIFSAMQWVAPIFTSFTQSSIFLQVLHLAILCEIELPMRHEFLALSHHQTSSSIANDYLTLRERPGRYRQKHH